MSGLSLELTQALERRDQAGRELRAVITLSEGVAAEMIGSFVKVLAAKERRRADRSTAYFKGSAPGRL